MERRTADIAVAAAGEQGDDGFGPARQPDCDTLAGDDALIGQVAGKSVHLRQQFAIAEVALRAADRDAIGRAFGVGLRQRVDGVIAPEAGAVMFLVAVGIEERQQRVRHRHGNPIGRVFPLSLHRRCVGKTIKQAYCDDRPAGDQFCSIFYTDPIILQVSTPSFPPAMAPIPETSQASLATANRMLAREGVLDAFGHVSRRHPADPDRFFLARSLAPELVTEHDILEFDLTSAPVTPTDLALYSERVIHGALYRARPDVQRHLSSSCAGGAAVLPGRSETAGGYAIGGDHR